MTSDTVFMSHTTSCARVRYSAGNTTACMVAYRLGASLQEQVAGRKQAAASTHVAGRFASSQHVLNECSCASSTKASSCDPKLAHVLHGLKKPNRLLVISNEMASMAAELPDLFCQGGARARSHDTHLATAWPRRCSRL
jgi:hypothetical protein